MSYMGKFSHSEISVGTRNKDLQQCDTDGSISPEELSPTRIVRSELLQNVKLDVYLKINRALPDRVLCIDGGGVKGIVEAVILRYLHYCLQRHHAGQGEHVFDHLKTLIQHDILLFDKSKVKKDAGLLQDTDDGDLINKDLIIKYDATAEPHLHEMFDIVAGTSTGSIIATAISRLHWNPQQLIDTSKVIAPLIFPKPSMWNLYAKMKKMILSGLSLFTRRINKYSAEPLEDYLEKTIGHIKWESDAHTGDNKEMPILGIITIKEENAQVHIFNSEVYRDSHTVTIKDAIRASTAAPTYFPSHKIIDDLDEINSGKSAEEMEPQAYVDGGLSANCPANYTMSMLQAPCYDLGCLISIGCGDDSPTYLPLKRVVQMAMNNEESWNSFYESHPKHQRHLFRITPSEQSGIGGYDLADSDKVNEMEETFIKSLLEEDSASYLQRIIQSTASLFANSLEITKATVKFDAKTLIYDFDVLLERRYDNNNKVYHSLGDSLKEGPPKILEFKSKDDEMLPVIKVLATFDERNDKIKFEYQGWQICGSPISISRKVTTFTNAELQ